MALPADRSTGSWFTRISYMQNQINQRVRSIRFKCLVGLLFSISLAGTSTRGDELSDIRGQIAALQQRLDALESVKNQVRTPTVSTSATASVDRKGLILKDEGNFSFRIRPRIQIDGLWFADEESGSNEFLLRRVRPLFQGEAGPLSWRFMPELAGTVRILDAWGDLNLNDKTYLRVGKFKQVVGYERLQSFSQLLFMERGLPSALTPVRDIGLELHRSFAAKAIDLTLGITNGALDESDLVSNTNLDSSDFDIGARIAFSPWIQSDRTPLKGLTFGFAATSGQENTVINDSDRDRRINYRSSGRNTFFRYQNGVVLDGERIRVNPFLSWYHGPVSLLTEWVRSSYELSYEGITETVGAQAWTVQAGWVITGEAASYNGVRPKHPLGSDSGLGAIEIGLRLHELAVDDEAFISHSGTVFARSNATQKATGYGAAFNWYLTDNLRLSANYEITDFSGMGADRRTENALLTRMQIDF